MQLPEPTCHLELELDAVALHLRAAAIQVGDRVWWLVVFERDCGDVRREVRKLRQRLWTGHHHERIPCHYPASTALLPKPHTGCDPTADHRHRTDVPQQVSLLDAVEEGHRCLPAFRWPGIDRAKRRLHQPRTAVPRHLRAAGERGNRSV